MDGGVLGEGMRSAGVLGEGVRAAELRSGTVSTGYDADDSSLSTGVSEALPGGSPLDGTPPERGCGFWLVVRVLQHQTEVYFQLRSVGSEGLMLSNTCITNSVYVYLS